MLCNPPVASPKPSLEAGSAPAARRRRLWQLSTQAHELLLAMSFAPEALRRQAARTLGQVHRGICILKGRDVDVLYSVVHDMATRNALSEAFQKRLDDVHAHPLRRFAALRETDALQAAWAQAVDEDTTPGALWALLTHPQGGALEQKVLYDARAWVCKHGRRSIDLSHTSRQADDRMREAQHQLAALRTRLLAQQQQADHALVRAKAEIARLNGEVARLQSTHGNAVAPAAFASRPKTARRQLS